MCILLGRMIYKQGCSVLDKIDHLGSDLLRNGRATKAATHIGGVRTLLTDILCAMYDHGSFFCIIIKAFIEARQFQR